MVLTHQTIVRDLWTLRLSRQLPRLEESAKVTEDSEDLSPFALNSGDETDLENANPHQAESSRKASDPPTLVQTIALCYMGILLLRLPMGLASIFR